jgi:putative membrane protein
MILSLEDQHRVGDAIKAAEARTSGEIVCVLARASSDYSSYALAAAALGALVSPWLLVAATPLSTHRILLIQLAVFAVLFLVLSAGSLRQYLVPRQVQRSAAHRAAMEQFMIRGISRKANRAGILIFVSLAEHYARIVADDGIASRVSQSVWQDAIDDLLERVAYGEIADGFIIAVERCGEVLAEHFPPGMGDEDQLPDRIYVI